MISRVREDTKSMLLGARFDDFFGDLLRDSMFDACVASGALLGSPRAHPGRQWGPRGGPKIIESRLRKGSQNRVGHQGRPRGSQGGSGR